MSLPHFRSASGPSQTVSGRFRSVSGAQPTFYLITGKLKNPKIFSKILKYVFQVLNASAYICEPYP